MAISTPNTNPNEWELIGEMYEDFEYESIIRYRKPPLLAPLVELGYDSSISNSNIINKSFQFATRNIYKDNQYSVLSPFSDVINVGIYSVSIIDGYPIENEGNYIDISISGQNKEVSAIELLCRDESGKWFVVESFINSIIDITFKFTNTSISKYISEDEASTPFDYIYPCDNSTTVNGRIVDGGLKEGRDVLDCDVDFKLSFSPIKEVPTNMGMDNPTITRSTSIVDNEAKFIFSITLSHVNMLVGGKAIYIANYITNSDGKKTAVFFYYNLDLNDNAKTIYSYINKYKPVYLSNNNGDFYVSGMSMQQPTSNLDFLEITIGVKSATGTPSIDSSWISGLVNSSLQFPVNKPERTIKSGCDLFVGIEFFDKNGVFYPSTKIHKISTPSKRDLYENTIAYENTFSYAIKPQTTYKTNLMAKINSVPSWAVGYRFIYFGSSFNKFIQYPISPITATSKNGENTDFTACLSISSYVKRKEFINISNKGVFSIEQNDFLHLPMTLISAYPDFIKKYRIVRIDEVDGKSVPVLSNDSLRTAVSGMFLTETSFDTAEVVDLKKDESSIGYSCPKTFSVNTVNSFVDTGVYNCCIRNAYDISEPFPSSGSGLIVNASFEDMLNSDYYTSIETPKGKVNVCAPKQIKNYLKGKIRNGGNYVDNTQINNLCRFSALDYAFVDDQYGKITQMYPVGQNLRVRQERNSSTVYIGNIQSVSPDGATQTLQSSKFLGFVDAGNTNIGSKYGGYFKIGSQEFFFDAATKNVYRQSQAGTFTISGKAFTQEGGGDYKIHKLITDISLSNNTKNIALGYDNENDILLLTFLGVENKTIGFHYPTQRWLSYYSFIPENYVSAGITNYYWESGKMYKMNKGERKPITYQFTSNGNPSIPKKFRSLEIIGDLVNFNMNCIIPSGSSYRDMYTRSNKITSKENKKYIELPRNMKTSSNTPSIAEKDSGIEMRGQFANFEVTGNLKLTSINVNND